MTGEVVPGFAELASPLGPLRLVFARDVLVHLDFTGNDARQARNIERRFARAPREHALPRAFSTALIHYFDGDASGLATLAVATGGTPFQRRVWLALRRLPFGCATTYGELAVAATGDARSSRAVGGAVGANPIAIVIPCHRVIGRDGRLTGFAGGLDRKRWLLRHEGIAATDGGWSAPIGRPASGDA